jgi:hypothetical protein
LDFYVPGVRTATAGETTAERDRETTESNGIGKIKEPNETTAAAHQRPLRSPIVTQRMWTLDVVGAAAISSACPSKDRERSRF